MENDGLEETVLSHLLSWVFPISITIADQKTEKVIDGKHFVKINYLLRHRVGVLVQGQSAACGHEHRLLKLADRWVNCFAYRRPPVQNLAGVTLRDKA